MTDDEVTAVLEEAKKGVHLFCDEYHVHSALQGCLSGDPKDVQICKLVEVIRRDRSAIREAAASIGRR